MYFNNTNFLFIYKFIYLKNFKNYFNINFQDAGKHIITNQSDDELDTKEAKKIIKT